MRRSLIIAISVGLLASLAGTTVGRGAAPGPDSRSAGDLPDLIPSQLRIDAAGDGDRCDVSFQLTIKDQARSDAGPYSVSVGVIRDQVEAITFPIFVDGTPRHGKASVTGSFGSLGGSYRIRIVVNEYQPIPESDFTNNSLLSDAFACPP